MMKTKDAELERLKAELQAAFKCSNNNCDLAAVKEL